jgi:hypothetical protein
MKNLDSYYDPPDDDPICEDFCGETLVRDPWTLEWVCVNKFCPSKFQGVEKEMAEALVEYMDKATDIPTLKRRYLTLDTKHDELKLKLDDLKLQLAAALQNTIIHKCKSCAGYYNQGYVCSCGRDNSYSDAEWNDTNK